MSQISCSLNILFPIGLESFKKRTSVRKPSTNIVLELRLFTFSSMSMSHFRSSNASDTKWTWPKKMVAIEGTLSWNCSSPHNEWLGLSEPQRCFQAFPKIHNYMQKTANLGYSAWAVVIDPKSLHKVKHACYPKAAEDPSAASCSSPTKHPKSIQFRSVKHHQQQKTY